MYFKPFGQRQRPRDPFIANHLWQDLPTKYPTMPNIPCFLYLEETFCCCESRTTPTHYNQNVATIAYARLPTTNSDDVFYIRMKCIYFYG